MKRYVSLFVTLLMVLCTLGSVVVFADEAPVITDGYMGGIPAVGQYLHVAVDGTYQGKTFENALTSEGAYAVTADYQWQYGEGESWTDATPVSQATRVCEIKNEMVDKYVRCIVTPKVGAAAGESYTVQFPGKMQQNITWKDTVLHNYAFDDASEASVLKDYGANCLSYDAEQKAMKLSGWPVTSENGEDRIKDIKVGWKFNVPVTVRTDSQILIRYSFYTDQGTISGWQTGAEGGGLFFTTKEVPFDPVRGGFYGNPTVTATKKQEEVSFTSYEVVTSAWNSGKKLIDKTNPSGVMTSAMIADAGQTSNIWFHPHIHGGNGALIQDGATAVYTDDVQVILKTVPYTVTYTSDGKILKTETVAGGSKTLALPVPAGQKVAALTCNGEDQLSRVAGDSFSPRHPVYQNLTVDLTFENVEVARVSLAGNRTNYVGVDRAAEKLNVKAYDAAGAEYDVTEWDGITYESSDPSVFTVTTDGMVASTGKLGKASISATYQGKTASVMMLRYPKDVEGRSEFAGQTAPVKTDSDVPSKYWKTDIAGHYKQGAFSLGTSITQKTWGQWGVYDMRLYEGRNNWSDKGYYSTGAWMYDDGVSPHAISCEMHNVVQYNDNGTLKDMNLDLPTDMSYGQFADYWKDATAFEGGLNVSAQLNQPYYYAEGKVTAVPRGKGWHQVIYSLGKDLESQSGWSTYVYIDGILAYKKTVIKSGSDPHFELRTKFTKTPDSAEDPITVYEHAFDDFVMGGSLEADIHGVQLKKTGNGTVAVAGAELANDGWTYVTDGKSVEVTLTPASNYEVQSVKLGEQDLPVSSNTVTLEGLSADSELKVVFAEKPPVEPEIANVETVTSFTEVEGQPAVYIYSKLNDFTASADGKEMGIKLWVKGKSANKIALPAMINVTTKAEVTPGQGFAIKAFGDAIKTDTTYVAQPYVGDREGEEKDIQFK